MRNALLIIVFVVLTILAIPVILVGAISGRGDIFLGYGTWMMRVGRSILGIDLAVEGLDRLDRETPYVFMSNHLSFLDGPLLVPVLDRPVRFIVKRFVLRIPVLGWGMKAAGYVPLDKEGMGEGRKRIARASRMIAEKGHSFLIYPEGTRSADGTLQRFRRGGFFLALDSGAPIVPVSIRGTYELMPRRTWHVRRGPVRIVFHEPIPVAGRTRADIPELMERVGKEIASAL